jgi:pimeloyl-ACP methyl ester carboxylesterase
VRKIGAELRPTEIAVVGYSLGGRLALAVAARHPDLAARVAVVSGSPGLQGVHAAVSDSSAYPAHPWAAPLPSVCRYHAQLNDTLGRIWGSGKSGACPYGTATQHIKAFATRATAGQAERAGRAARDARLSTGLLQGGGTEFVDSWYRGPLWRQLRAHPAFERTVQNRKDTGAPCHQQQWP